jgi:transcriptional regulator with XRE-family HTH domain
MKNGDHIKKEFGNRLRQLREKREWAQTDLAYEADIEPGYVSRLELGKANPSLTVIVAIIKALDCKVDELITP